MKKLTGLILLIILLAVWSATAQTQDNNSNPNLVLNVGVSPNKGLDNVYKQFSAGYRKLDPKIVADLYTDDAAYLAPKNNIVIGRDEILRSFKSFFDSVKENKGGLEIEFHIFQRQINKDLAYDVGIYKLTNTNEKGEKSQGSGKFVVVAKRGKNNIWRFQVDGYSDLPSQK